MPRGSLVAFTPYDAYQGGEPDPQANGAREAMSKVWSQQECFAAVRAKLPIVQDAPILSRPSKAEPRDPDPARLLSRVNVLKVACRFWRY
jgi:hypothetical protein